MIDCLPGVNNSAHVAAHVSKPPPHQMRPRHPCRFSLNVAGLMGVDLRPTSRGLVVTSLIVSHLKWRISGKGWASSAPCGRSCPPSHSLRTRHLTQGVGSPALCTLRSHSRGAPGPPRPPPPVRTRQPYRQVMWEPGQVAGPAGATARKPL